MLHEEEREEGGRDEQEKKGDSREERQIYAVLFSKVFSIAQTPTKIHRVALGREGEGRK